MTDQQANKIVLGPDCWIKGQMQVGGDLQLFGQCEGVIHVGGTLEIREGATLTGLARAGAVRVSGRVEADLVGEEGIALLEGCHVTGRIYSPRLMAVKGATLRAEVCIGPEALNDAPGREIASSVAAQQVTAPKPVDESQVIQEQSVVENDIMKIGTTQQAAEAEDAEEPNEPSVKSNPISVAAALDDADDMSMRTVESPAPVIKAEVDGESLADISTVPQSIRSVLQRRNRIAAMSSQPRRTA